VGVGTVSLPLPTRLLLNQEEAASYCGVSVNTFRAHVKVTPVKIGNTVRYDRRALDRWAARQTSSEPLSGDDWLERLDAGGEGVRG
jgi:predicted DNA-binding transcriptional regulator AlpA